MHKQKKYISLLLLTSAISGVRAMDLTETGNIISGEEVKDKYALLQSKLSATERQALQYKVNALQEHPTPSRDQIKEAYQAVLALEADQHPTARTKDVLTTRKNLWGMLQETSITDKVNAHEEVAYLSGSEEEQDLTKRIARRDRHMAAQTQLIQTREGLLKREQMAGAALDAQLTELADARKPHDVAVEAQGEAEVTLKLLEATVQTKHDALNRIIDGTVAQAQCEDAFGQVAREQLIPTKLAAEIETEQKDVAAKLAALALAREATQKQLTPLAQLITKLTAEKETSSHKQIELAQLVETAKNAKTYAEEDKAKLILALEQQLDQATQKRDELQAEALKITEQISAEKSETAKAELVASKKAKDTELTQAVTTVGNLKLAIDTVTGQYSKWGYWISGKYNGTK